MLASGGVGFAQEVEGIIYPSELGSLAYLPLVVFTGSFQNGLPHVMCERLVGIECICQLAAYPGFCDFFVSIYPAIYVPGAFCQCSIGLFDLLHLLICPVDRVAIQLTELSQVVFVLSLLTCYGPDPDHGVGQFYCLFRC